MAEDNIQRKLTAILSADAKGYSRLMGQDDVATIQTLKKSLEIMTTEIQGHHGRVIDSPGDNLLAEFVSIVDAVKCALLIQDRLNQFSSELPEDRRMPFRIGVNLGDVIVDGERIYGEGVNIAARLEGFAEAGGICVSQETLNQVENKVAATFTDLGTYPLKNIEKPLRIFKVSTNGKGTEENSTKSNDTLISNQGPREPRELKSGSDYVSIAVLPFEGGSENYDRKHLGTGFIEDLIVDLSRYSGLRITSPYTARLLGDGDVDIFDAAQEISISYLLKGNIRFVKDNLRIHTQLLNTATRNVLWAERYDTTIDSFFDVQDSIVEQIVFTIQSEVDQDLLSVARNKPSTSLEVYDCWLRGMAKLRHGTLESDREARDFFNRALTMDSNYARAYAGLSLSHFNEWSCQLWELYDESEQLAYKYATQAAQLDDTDHLVHMILGRVYIFRRQFDEAEFHIDRSLSLNGSDADNLIQLATCMALLGRVAEGEGLVNKALQLNPYRNLWYYQYGSFVHFVKKDYQQSIEMALKRQLTKIWVDLPGYIAASYAYLHQKEQALMYLEMFRSAFQTSITKGKTPTAQEMINWVKMANPFKYESDTENIIEGLQLAGIHVKRSGQAMIPRISDQPSSRAASIFKKEQAIWRIEFDEKEITLTNMKGLADINRLLQIPETDIHCTDLMGSESSMDETSFTIDEKARQAYKQRLRELQEDIAKAEGQNDYSRVVKLKVEYDQLIDHLSKSLGVGNQARKLKSPTERARSAVTIRIKKAIKRISTHHPPLGKHLSNSIKTGVFCTYTPEEDRQWVTQ